MVLPVGVVLGTIIFMFMYFYLEREDEKNHAVIVSHGLRVSDLEDMVDKFTSRIGEREIETEAGRAGLLRAASMIEGRLGPQNVGYPVRRSEGEAAHGLLWKSLSVEILGEERPQEVIFAAVSYAGAGAGCGREYRIHYDDVSIIHGSRKTGAHDSLCFHALQRGSSRPEPMAIKTLLEIRRKLLWNHRITDNG